MIVGHFATALFPRHRMPAAPLWLLLLCANLADFLWIALGFAGLEAPEPSSMLEATFGNMKVEMPFSHDLLPTLALAGVTSAVVWLGWRRGPLAAWCGALVVLHLVCDLVCGFRHNVAGPQTPAIGMNLYGAAPMTAIVLETVFGALCVAWFLWAERRAGRPISRGRALGLFALFAGGAIVWLPTATIPLGNVFGIAR